MRCNYHIHTYRCGHACGTEEEYIRKAISEGIYTLGFSDHTPYPLRDGYLSYCRMELSETDGYFATLSALKEKYKGYIDIKIGFETEYYPMYFDRLIDLYRKHPAEYIIYAGHFFHNEGEDGCVCAFDRTADARKMRLYADNAVAAIRTGRFSMLAHPDVMYFTGDLDVYREENERIIREANRFSLPLEINLYGIRDSRHYPNDEFWRLAGKLGAKAVLGFDAHHPKHVADQNEIVEGLRYADRFGIEVVDEIKLIDPRF